MPRLWWTTRRSSGGWMHWRRPEGRCTASSDIRPGFEPRQGGLSRRSSLRVTWRKARGIRHNSEEGFGLLVTMDEMGEDAPTGEHESDAKSENPSDSFESV